MHRPCPPLPLLRYQPGASLREKPLPALQQMLHGISIWCTRRKPFLQGHKSARLVLADINRKERLGQAKSTSTAFVGNGEPHAASLLDTPGSKLRITRLEQLFDGHSGQRGQVAVERGNRIRTIEARQMANNLLAREPTRPVGVK